MRTLSKLILASLALSLPITLVACGNGEPTPDGNDGGSNSGGTGNNSGGTGNNSGGTGNIGGDTGTGGVIVIPTVCEYEKAGGFCLDDCQATAGPGPRVLNAEYGAFTANKTWMDGWTNWSTNTSNLTAAQKALPATVIAADITADITFTSDKVWVISGTVHVTNNAVLTIEPGTLIKGDNNPQGTLVISRDGRIEAEGTAALPIVFTSSAVDGDRAKGQWGGLVLLGRASNFSGLNVNIEGLAADALNRHGPGDNGATPPVALPADDGHNCGTVKYVRIEFGGIELAADSEINGLTVGSCGSDTVISHVEVNTTLDDGFEFFGGVLDADHLVVNNAGDDMFDFDTGWRGTIDTAFGRQVVPTTDDPNGFEWDSSNAGASETPGNVPATNAKAVNVTLCGTGQLGKPNFGAVLREKITGSIDNLAVMGFDAAFDVRDNFLAGGTGPGPKLTIQNSASWYQVDGVAYEEDATKVTGTAACNAEPDKFICNDDLDFDEILWFAAGAGNVDLDE